MTLHPGYNLDRVVDLASEMTLNPWAHALTVSEHVICIGETQSAKEGH